MPLRVNTIVISIQHSPNVSKEQMETDLREKVIQVCNPNTTVIKSNLVQTMSYESCVCRLLSLRGTLMKTSSITCNRLDSF